MHLLLKTYLEYFTVSAPKNTFPLGNSQTTTKPFSTETLSVRACHASGTLEMLIDWN